MSEAALPVSEALSVDEAIASLVQPEQDTAPEAPVEAAEEPEDTEGETSSPEEAAEGAENPEDGEEAQEAEPTVESLEPPAYWSKDAKERFADLPPELQAVVLEQEGPREAAAAKAKAEAAEIRQRAEADLGKVNELAVALSQRLPEWQQAFAAKWGDKAPDWVAVAREHGAEAASIAKMEYEADQQRLAEAQRETAKAQTIAHEQFVRTEAARLAEIAPDLADPEKGAERRTQVAEFLLKQGIPQDALRQISAVEMAIARDAMRYRELQAASQAKPKPKPSAPAPKATVRPSAAPAQSSNNPSAQAAQRFGKSRSVEDAIAFLASRG